MLAEQPNSSPPNHQAPKELIESKRDLLLEQLYDFELYRKQMIQRQDILKISMLISTLMLILGIGGLFFLSATLLFNSLLGISLGLLGLELGIYFLLRYDFRNKAKAIFFTPFIRVLYPHLEYSPFEHPSIDNFKSWSKVEGFKQLMISKGEDYLYGKIGQLSIEIGELLINGKPKIFASTPQQSNSEIAFSGILLLIKGLPNGIDQKHLEHNAVLAQELKRMEFYWGAYIYWDQLEDGRYILHFAKNRPFLELRLARKDAVYQQKVLEQTYNDLHHCLHIIELFEQELLKNP